jgi:hypothetical protein
VVKGAMSILAPSITIPSPLTAGVMRVRGGLSVLCGGALPFNASGTHLTVFDGAAVQVVNLGCSSSTQQRFQNVHVTNAAAGVTFDNTTFIGGDLTLSGALTMVAFRTLTVSGAIAIQAGATLTNAGTISAGSCSNSGGTVTNTGSISCTSGSF